ncbi:BREX-1 system adenine-specific DNA-methyltransferase PglX [Lacticaseibacillus mingshuiensis]|uniref:BREX-1 system adenine-specific DNA-methyltransferase PglX n=1 Tax=Lacticaseibacillus mingshuiensis TaxID=2799574 RepID=A0ABW4CGA3_9LACO|nr:BREX-1 system adenine-specific DNA-methyltransferase PglX [Lacticaseibacillus mingshuiensis]
MDKKIISKFAIDSHLELVEAVRLRLAVLGITEEAISSPLPESTQQAEFFPQLNGEPLTGDDILRRRKIVAHLSEVSSKGNSHFEDFVEEVAYTWFNRILAIRFMEVNDYLPSGTRVLSSTEGKSEPDILVYANDLEQELGGYSKDDHKLIEPA